MEQVKFASAPVIAEYRDLDDPFACLLQSIEQFLGIKGMPVNLVQKRPYLHGTVSFRSDGIVAVGHMQEQVRAHDKELTCRQSQKRSSLDAYLFRTDHCIIVPERIQGSFDKIEVSGEIRIQAQQKRI